MEILHSVAGDLEMTLVSNAKNIGLYSANIYLHLQSQTETKIGPTFLTQNPCDLLVHLRPGKSWKSNKFV